MVDKELRQGQHTLPDIQFDGTRALQLQTPHWLNEGVLLEELNLELPHAWQNGAQPLPSNIKQVRNTLQQLRCRFDRTYLTNLISRTLSGGGLSDLQIQVNGARVEINGILSREGRRTPFWTRGFLLEQAGPFGGAVFYDIRLYGRPGLPAPALIPLLSARTGRHGPVRVHGVVTLQFDPLSLLLRYGMASAGWKIPSYQRSRLSQIDLHNGTIHISYQTPQGPQSVTPLAKRDPLYGSWMALRQAEQLFFKAESLIGRGEYNAAIQAYEEELWRHPRNLFVQERLMQLYIASPQKELWNKAYQLADEMIHKDNQALAALNCLAQYAEGIQDNQMASHFYTQMGEVSRAKQEHTEAALAFGKAAELLENIDPQKAHQLWQQTRQENPRYRPAIAALARHALKAGRYDEAESVLQDLISQTPASIERARHHLSLAGLYRSRLRDLERARQQLEFAAPYLNEDIAYLREFAEYRLATDDNLDALRILDRLLERVRLLNHPTLYSDIMYRTGQILEERLAQPPGALHRYLEVIKTRPNHTPAQTRAQNLQNKKVYPTPFNTKSVDALSLQINEKQRVLQNPQHLSPPDLANTHLDLAKLYWQKEDAEKALQHGNQAIQIQSTLEAAWQLMEEICVRSERQGQLAAIHRDMAQKALFDLDAIRHLEEALRFVPQDTETLGQLSQRYHKLRQWDKLDTLYSRWIETSEPNQAADLWQKKAQLLEQQLQRPTEAEVAYIQAYQTAQDRIPYIDELVQFYIRHNEWDKLDRQLERLAQGIPPQEQAALYAEKGRLLTDHPRKLEEALQAYQTALELEPNSTAYLKLAIELAQGLEKFELLTELLAQLTQVSDDTSELLPLRLELANVYLEQNNLESAKKEYLHILDSAPKETTALEQLASIYQQLDDAPNAIKTYETLLKSLKSTQSDLQLQTLKHLIPLYETEQNEKRQLECVQQLLKTKPNFGAHHVHAAKFKGDDPLLPQAHVLFLLGQEQERTDLILHAARLLEDKHTSTANLCLDAALQAEPFAPHIWMHKLQAGDDTKRSKVWDSFVKQFAQHQPTPAQTEQLNELFQQLEALLSPEEVQDIHEKLQTHQIQIPKLSFLYINQLEMDDNLDQANQIRQAIIPLMPQGPERTAVQLELAIQQIRILDDRDGGRKNLWNIVTEEPRHLDAFYELQQLYEEEDDLKGFVTQLEDVAKSTTPGPERADLYIQTFELYRDLLADPDEARALLDRTHQNAQDDSHTLRVIAAAYEEADAFEEAANVYQTAAEHGSDPKDAIFALERAGEIFHSNLDQPDRAMDIYQMLLEKDPTNNFATEQLKELYESLWMWPELAALTEHQTKHAEDPKVRAQHLYFLADLYLGRMEDYEKALDTYRWSLRVNPKDLRTLQSLYALYEDLEDWPAASSALKAMARAEVDPNAICDLYIKIATLSLDRLDRIEDTEKYFKLARNQNPDRLEPLKGLVDFYDATGAQDELIKSAAQLSILSQKHDKPNDAKEALRTMLQTIERLDETIDPKSTLRTVLLDQQESAELARQVFDLLNELTKQADAPEAASSIPAQLYHNNLHELSWLLRVWEENEEESIPPQEKQRLVDLALLEDWKQLLEALDNLTQTSHSLEETASYRLSMAEVALHHIGDHAQATKYAQGALQLGAPPERALPILEQIQQGESDLPALVDTVEEFVHPDEKIRAFFHLGSLFLLQQEWHSGLHALIEAAAQDPNLQFKQARDTLRQLVSQANPNTPLADLEAQIPPSLTQHQSHILRAWLHFSYGLDNDAISHLEKAFELDPEDISVPVLRTLGAYHYCSAQPDQASFYLYRYLEIEWERLPFDEVVEVCLQLANLAEQEENWDDVLFYVEQAEKFIPEDQRIFGLHILALERTAQWEDLRMLYENRIDYPEPTDDLANLWYSFGRLQLNQFNDPEEAQLCYQRALKMNPNHEKTLEALRQWNVDQIL